MTNYQNAITFIDTNTNKVSNTIQTDSNFTPSGIAISSDGAYALVTNYEPPPDAFLAVVDIAGKTISRTIPLDTEYPQSVYINPDGTLAWVTFPWDNRVEVIDIMTGMLVRALVFETPYSVAFNLIHSRWRICRGGIGVQHGPTWLHARTESAPFPCGLCRDGRGDPGGTGGKDPQVHAPRVDEDGS